MMTHAQRYQHLIFLAGQKQPKDIQYCAAFYCLSSNDELFLWACNSVNHNGIHFDRLEEKSFDLSDSNRLLVEIAHNIFSCSSSCHDNPFQNLSQLEAPQFLIALNSIGIAGGKFKLTVEQEQFVIDHTPLQKQLAFYAQIETISNQ